MNPVKWKFMMIDPGGLHIDTARKLGQEGHKVYYYSPWCSAYSKFDDFAPGVGFPEMEKVAHWASHIDEVDCTIFPDVGMGDLADWLRSKGYVVFGAGRGEELEEDRALSVKIMDQLGIKHPKTHVATGVDEALEIVKTLVGQKNETNQNATGNCFVKFNIFRGTIDSFPVGNIEEAEYMFNKVSGKLGPYAKSIPVCIQETVKGLECGADCFHGSDGFLMPGMIGFEDGGNYVGYITDDMGIYKNDLDRISKYLRSINYRGAFSFECIYDGKDCYWIDITARFPAPLGLLYPSFIDDFAYFMVNVATGQAQNTPLPMGEYLACMQLKSENAIDEYLQLRGGANTKFVHHMMQDEKTYSVPGISLLGICAARGESFAECERNIQKEAKELNIFFLDKDENFIETIKEKYVVPMSELGVSFGPETDSSLKKAVRPSSSPILKNTISAETDFWGIPR